MVAKNSPSFFSNKSVNTNKKCMVWTFFMLKHCTTSAPNTRKQPYVYQWSLIFFHKLRFGDIELSDLERRNRKLSAHDCTDHIKTLFSSDNYHETRNIKTRQVAMLLVPGHNCATLLVPVHKVHNVLPYFSWNRIDRSCCGGIITGRFISLLIKKYQQDKK